MTKKVELKKKTKQEWADDADNRYKAIRSDMVAKKVVQYTPEEYKAMLEQERAKYGNDKHNWNEGKS